jgi:hypothetical protein
MLHFSRLLTTDNYGTTHSKVPSLPMDQSKKEKEAMREWWAENKEVQKLERKIDKVYEAFKEYCVQAELPPINKYIFRTYIRKHGYCNS